MAIIEHRPLAGPQSLIVGEAQDWASGDRALELGQGLRIRLRNLGPSQGLRPQATT